MPLRGIRGGHAPSDEDEFVTPLRTEALCISTPNPVTPPSVLCCEAWAPCEFCHPSHTDPEVCLLAETAHAESLRLAAHMNAVRLGRPIASLTWNISKASLRSALRCVDEHEILPSDL